MLLLLPPSETKRDGGRRARLDLARLSIPELTEPRAALVSAVVRLAEEPELARHALRLGRTLDGEIARNRRILDSPTMPALDRYTGVLFDALDAGSLDQAARRYARGHLLVHSALFGLLGALDPIPAYRLSHDSRVPGFRLRAHWREANAAALAARRGLVVDLRSEGYLELGPAPRREGSVYVRVVTADAGGRRRALNHFNKHAKGELARAILEHRPRATTVASFLDWAAGAGFRLEPGGEPGPGGIASLELLV